MQILWPPSSEATNQVMFIKNCIFQVPTLSKWNFFPQKVILQSGASPMFTTASGYGSHHGGIYQVSFSQCSCDLWVIPGICCQTSLKTSWIMAKTLMSLLFPAVPKAGNLQVASMVQSPQTDGDRELIVFSIILNYTVLVFYRCYNKLSWTQWLKPIQFFILYFWRSQV